jgi:hypothetical protein
VDKAYLLYPGLLIVDLLYLLCSLWAHCGVNLSAIGQGRAGQGRAGQADRQGTYKQ